MGQRRANRGLQPRTDGQILDHPDDLAMLRAIAHGRVTVSIDNRMQLRRLAREELCLAGFGSGVAVALLPRGQRIVAAVHGELPEPIRHRNRLSEGP